MKFGTFVFSYNHCENITIITRGVFHTLTKSCRQEENSLNSKLNQVWISPVSLHVINIPITKAVEPYHRLPGPRATVSTQSHSEAPLGLSQAAVAQRCASLWALTLTWIQEFASLRNYTAESGWSAADQTKLLHYTWLFSPRHHAVFAEP